MNIFSIVILNCETNLKDKCGKLQYPFDQNAFFVFILKLNGIST